MSELREAVERMVREVLVRMGHPVVAGSVEPQAGRAPGAEQNDVSGSTLTINRRVLTLADLPEKLDGVCRVVVPLGAVVTPLAQDELQRRQIKLVMGEPEPFGDERAGAVLMVAAAAYDAAPLAAALKREGLPVESRREDCLVRATDQLATDLASGSRMGLLLTSHGAVAICLANRHAGVRAILGASADAVAADADAVGANLLVLDPSALGFFAVKQMASRFLRAGPRPCPKVFQKQLG